MLRDYIWAISTKFQCHLCLVNVNGNVQGCWGRERNNCDHEEPRLTPIFTHSQPHSFSLFQPSSSIFTSLFPLSCLNYPLHSLSVLKCFSLRLSLCFFLMLHGPSTVSGWSAQSLCKIFIQGMRAYPTCILWDQTFCVIGCFFLIVSSKQLGESSVS